MAGGETTIGIVLGAGTLIGLAYAGSRLLAAMAANKLPPMPIYGDWPHVPTEAEGLAAARKPGGERVAANGGQRSHRDVIARRHSEGL